MEVSALAICSICRQALSARGECLACLLRGGLDEAAESYDSPGYGDFEIARREDGSLWELGSGAMGVTYRAHDKILHRAVALKVIEIPESSGDAEAIRSRFLREARAAAALKHPNVAGIFQFSAAPESTFCFYAMELVEGETLEALVRREGPLAWEQALEMSIQIARALAAAAAQGLIHRDLKPGNIMLARENETATLQVKVIDFGLAKTMNAIAEADLTHGSFIGTPAFASPEQFAGEPADARSDIYSLGGTLWYALTGQVPYPGRTIPEIRTQQLEVSLPLEQMRERRVPTALIEVVQGTLALDPAQRPVSAKDLLGKLETCRAKLHSPFRAKNLALIGGVVFVLATICVFLLQKNPPRAAEKSVAVLPFDNSSENEERTTSDLTAFALYNQAKTLSNWTDLEEFPHERPRVIELLQAAIKRDPKFALAYCSLAQLYSHAYNQAVSGGKDSAPVQQLWREAIDHAMQLRPDLGQPHLALAQYNLFLGQFDAARSEIAIARTLLPDNSDELFLEGRIDRHQNRWDDSLAHVRRAYELNPQNGELIQWLCQDYGLMRRYAEGEQFAYLAMKRKPAMTSTLYGDIAQMKLDEGDPQGAQGIVRKLSPALGNYGRFLSAMYLRDYDSAAAALANDPADPVERTADGQPTFTLADGEVARARGDESAARVAFQGARDSWEKENARKDEGYFSGLALLDAGLGRKEEAIREARRAVELVPIESDPLFGADMMAILAQVYALTGEPDLAIEKLEMLAKMSGGISYGDLRFNPCWDSLRNRPRFEKVVASLKPTTR